MDAVGKAVEKIARTCLYEGYLLWPYRRSALKNAQRWTFGGVYPRAHAAELGEPGRMRTEVLLEVPIGADAPPPAVRVRLRFLQVVDRQVTRAGPDGPEPVDDLTVDGRRHLSWQEATEREVVLPAWTPDPAAPGARTPVEVPAGAERESLTDGTGATAGALVRSWRHLTGTVETRALRVADGALRLTVTVENTTGCPAPDPADRRARDTLAAHAFVSTHTVLSVDGGVFVSLADPPPHLREAAAGCRNEGTWPVLVSEDAVGGGADTRRTARAVLSSPVTLHDFPAVAPESPGDLFDGTEIDQLLVLSVLSMSEEEREEARACDPRAREILDRCAALTPEDLARLHGGVRAVRPLEQA